MYGASCQAFTLVLQSNVADNGYNLSVGIGSAGISRHVVRGPQRFQCRLITSCEGQTQLEAHSLVKYTRKDRGTTA